MYKEIVGGWGGGHGLEKASRGRNPPFLLYLFFPFSFLPSNRLACALAMVGEPSGVGECVEK